MFLLFLLKGVQRASKSLVPLGTCLRIQAFFYVISAKAHSYLWLFFRSFKKTFSLSIFWKTGIPQWNQESGREEQEREKDFEGPFRKTSVTKTLRLARSLLKELLPCCFHLNTLCLSKTQVTVAQWDSIWMKYTWGGGNNYSSL